jgi:hypothetical protein
MVGLSGHLRYRHICLRRPGRLAGACAASFSYDFTGRDTVLDGSRATGSAEKNMNPHIHRSGLALVAALLAFSLLGTACAASGPDETHGLPMAPMQDLPELVQKAAPRTVLAFRLASKQETLLRRIPCYCGCVALGHRDNYECYVAGVEADGQVRYDIHAFGCAICVNITHDALRLQAEGKSPGDIRAFIDLTYAESGPGTNTVMP